MNKQDKGNGNRGISWCDFTWNPIAGCQHACEWMMPDGQVATCYADDAAQSVQRQTGGKLYPQGFAYHYWYPERLGEPAQVKTPVRIFVGSMADVFGSWVPEAQIRAVLEACAAAEWHTFQFLTKNTPRLLQFEFPPNCWIGVSVPPSHFRGRALSLHQQERMVQKTLDVLAKVKATVRWMSIEPLSWDLAPELAIRYPLPLEWAVIGAASKGSIFYQPEQRYLLEVLSVLDNAKVPIFFKENLRPSAVKWLDRWREEFPSVHTSIQMSLFGGGDG